jgi:hypothetical protein
MNGPEPDEIPASVAATARFIRNAVVGYALIGCGYGLREFLYQSSRFDPGFDPMFTGALAVVIWPLHFYFVFVAIFRR